MRDMKSEPDIDEGRTLTCYVLPLQIVTLMESCLIGLITTFSYNIY